MREAEKHGLAQMSAARSNRQADVSGGGKARESSETPELAHADNVGSRGGTGNTGSGPSGMETERGGNSNEQGVVGSNKTQEEPPLTQQDGLAVSEVARKVAKTGLEEGGLAEQLQQHRGEAQAEAEGEERERRAPPKVFMLESSDEDEADVDDEEGGGLDEIDDLDGSWQTTLSAKHLRVLLVEDDDCTRHVVSALLRNCGYEVTPAADGFQALKLLSDALKHFDLVLTEVVMPGLSGIQLLSRIQQRDQHKRMPVIMMSSKDTTDVVFKCFQRGAADFLVKPVRKNELKNLWQHVWRRCKSSCGSGSGGSGTNTAAKKAPKMERGRVRDGSGDRSGSGSDSAGGQINAGGNGSDNGSGTRNESSPAPDCKLEAAETSPPLEHKPSEVQREETPERGAEDFLTGMKGEDVSRREPMRERDGDAQAGETKDDLEGSPSRDSGKAADLIGNFVGDEKADTPCAKGGVNEQQAERGSEGAAPGLELSLKRSRPVGDSILDEAQPPSKQQLRTLRQSGGSAFSRYSMGGALTNSSRQSQNQPTPGGYSSGTIRPPHNGGSAINSFMPEFPMPSAFQMPSHLLPPDFSNPRTVEAGPELQGPPRHNSGEISSAAKRPNGSGNEPAGPPPPQMKEEYSAGPMRPASIALPPQGFLPPRFSDPGFGPPFPPQFGYYFPQGTPPNWMANPRKEPPNTPLAPPSNPPPPPKDGNPHRPPNKEVNIHHHHHHHHHTHHHDANQRHHDARKHHKVSHPQAARAGEAPGGSESGLAGSSRQEIAQSRMEQAGKVAAHLDRAEHMERDSQRGEAGRHEALDNSGGSDNANGNSSGNQSGAANTSGGGSNFGSNGRSSATPGSGATTETGTATGASGTGAEPAVRAHPTAENASEMGIDGVDDVDKSARREAALNKFRQKRKERNFEKKVRYQSRKRLAEQRPRIRGQFVRQTTFPSAVQQFVRPGSQGESL